MTEGKLIDKETTSILLETLEEAFYDVVDEFLIVGQELSDQIEELCTNEPVDTEKLIVMIHTLKGASGNIGGEHLAALCQSLETDLQNDFQDNLQQRISQIVDSCKQTRHAFQEQFRKAS